MKIQLDRIQGSPRPIRTSWDEDALNELAKSIAEQGVIVPIKVRPTGDGYEVVYGHRRVEAARRANLTEIEAIVEGVDDTAALVQALIENVQREDMNPLDKARALKTLMDETGWPQREIHRQGIMDKSSISRLLALLDVEPDIQRLVTTTPNGDVPRGRITEYHVREAQAAAAVAGVSNGDTSAVLRKAADEGLTAAQTRAVAETVAKTQDPERRKALLETPYNPFTHNPEYAEANERADRIMAPAPGEDFARLPEIAVALEQIKKLREAMRLTAEAIEIGKASPEAKRFIGRRMIDLGKELIKRGEALTS